jgi:hypothetical protein
MDKRTSGSATPSAWPHCHCLLAGYAKGLIPGDNARVSDGLHGIECERKEGRKKTAPSAADGRCVSVSSGCVPGASLRPPDAGPVTENRIDRGDALPDPTHDRNSH